MPDTYFVAMRENSTDFSQNSMESNHRFLPELDQIQ